MQATVARRPGRAATEEQLKNGIPLFLEQLAPNLGIAEHRERLQAALANLLQNALKFTRPSTEVTLTAYAVGGQVFMDVQDHCGGLADGAAEKLFAPFSQRSDDKTGLGLGLSIARQSVEAGGGALSVKNVPGSGCVFTISLPLYALQHS